MRIFISAGEPSGDIHGANLIRALRRRRPDVDCVGFGGPHMAEAGANLLYPLTELAVMGLARVFANVLSFMSLLSRADRYFRHHRPDAVVLIDYPGFNWWIARRAKAHGIPVFYFVAPQLWAWAGWRVKKMRRFVDHVLCTLPFEPAWYAERGVAAHYVGHPFFDEVPAQRLDPDFMARQQQDGAPIVGILPGSRNQEIGRNLSTQVRAAGLIQRARPDVRFLVACYRASQKKTVDHYLARHPGLAIATHTGRTPEIIELSTAVMAVSGSVSLELLHRGTPSNIVYRIGKLDLKVSRILLKAKYMTLVNLLAERMVFPEYLTDRNECLAMSQDILTWLNVPAERQAVVAALADLKARYAQPGACSRAADFIVDHLAGAKRRAA
jgi:lipid-A-disaccharide synthase